MSTVEAEIEVEVARGPFDDLVERVATPFTPAASGEDPRYLDEFLAAKQEIDKLTGTDFEAVERNCITILTEHAKDLRIAGYLTLALSVRHGITGLAAGLRISRELIESFWDSCYPMKATQRRSALDWCNNPRFVGLIEKLDGGNDIDVARSVVETLEAINGLLAERLAADGDAPQWMAIHEWGASQLAELQSRIVPPPAPAQPAPQGGTGEGGAAASETDVSPAAPALPGGGEGGAPLPSNIESESGLIEAVRGLATYLQSKGERARAASFARALRWGGLRQPPNEGGKTRIPAPRRSGWRGIDEAEQAGDLESAFIAAESAFFEPGCHLAFDLQMRACDVARALKDDALLLTIETAVAGLVRRIPNIVTLRFDDDTPFVSGAALSWIESLAEGAGGAASGGADDALRETLRKAQEVQQEKGLPHALQYLDATPARTGRERFALELSKADMLLRGNRADIAEALLVSLVERADLNRLDEWEPRYAVDARFKLRRVLEQRLADASDGEKKEIKARIEALGQSIGRIDATMAAMML